MAATAEALTPKFEERYYHALRHELAPAIGAIGVEAAVTTDLETLEQRRRTEVISTLAEGLKPETKRSIIDTRYPLEIKDGRVVAEDGEPLADMLARALEADMELAASDSFYNFLVQRTEHEIAELEQWEAMAGGRTGYNTLVTFSPYAEEFDDGTAKTHKKLRRANMKPYWRRGMYRVTHAQDDKLWIFNYSSDDNSVELMAETARRQFGYEFETKDSTGMLGERIELKIEDDSWRFIAPRLVATNDEILSERFGGVWKHGHDPDADVRQAQAYVESQTAIVDSLLAIDKQLALKHSRYEDYEAEWLRAFYDGLSLLNDRLEYGRENEPVVDYELAAGVAGDSARAEGTVYDACGLVIGADAVEGRHISAGAKAGFESLMRLENKPISCVNCKKKVVVDKKYLAKGELHCNHCGYHLDVCTGKTSFTKGRPKPAEVQPNLAEVISLDLARKEAERKQKEAFKQAKAETA